MTEQKDCPHGYWICEDRPGGIVRQRCRYCGFTKDIANPFILPDNYADGGWRKLYGYGTTHVEEVEHERQCLVEARL